MQIWLVERVDSVRHDEISSFVCTAMNADDALHINSVDCPWLTLHNNGYPVPNEHWEKLKEDSPWLKDSSRPVWKVTSIGIPHDLTEAKVICEDFLEP